MYANDRMLKEGESLVDFLCFPSTRHAAEVVKVVLESCIY